MLKENPVINNENICNNECAKNYFQKRPKLKSFIKQFNTCLENNSCTYFLALYYMDLVFTSDDLIKIFYSHFSPSSYKFGYSNQKELPMRFYILISLSCLIIASKFNENDPHVPNMSNFVSLCSEFGKRDYAFIFDLDDIVAGEVITLKSLKYKLQFYSVYHFVLFFFTHGLVFKSTIERSKLYGKYNEKKIMEKIYFQSREIIDLIINKQEYYYLYMGNTNYITAVEITLWSIEKVLDIKINNETENIFKLIYNIEIEKENHQKIFNILNQIVNDSNNKVKTNHNTRIKNIERNKRNQDLENSIKSQSVKMVPRITYSIINTINNNQNQNINININTNFNGSSNNAYHINNPINYNIPYQYPTIENIQNNLHLRNSYIRPSALQHSSQNSLTNLQIIDVNKNINTVIPNNRIYKNSRVERISYRGKPVINNSNTKKEPQNSKSKEKMPKDSSKTLQKIVKIFDKNNMSTPTVKNPEMLRNSINYINNSNLKDTMNFDNKSNNSTNVSNYTNATNSTNIDNIIINNVNIHNSRRYYVGRTKQRSNSTQKNQTPINNLLLNNSYFLQPNFNNNNINERIVGNFENENNESFNISDKNVSNIGIYNSQYNDQNLNYFLQFSTTEQNKKNKNEETLYNSMSNAIEKKFNKTITISNQKKINRTKILLNENTNKIPKDNKNSVNVNTLNFDNLNNEYKNTGNEKKNNEIIIINNNIHINTFIDKKNLNCDKNIKACKIKKVKIKKPVVNNIKKLKEKNEKYK